MFQEATGFPPATYFRKERLKRARHLLETTPMVLAEICEEVGIPQVASLCRGLKEQFGKTAKELRAQT